MSAQALPVERSFATGHQGGTLTVMVCKDWLWAGLYASPHSATPTEIAVATAHTVRIDSQQLLLGHGRFPLTRKSLQAAHRWLDRQGVAVHEISPSLARVTRKVQHA